MPNKQKQKQQQNVVVHVHNEKPRRKSRKKGKPRRQNKETTYIQPIYQSIIPINPGLPPQGYGGYINNQVPLPQIDPNSVSSTIDLHHRNITDVPNPFNIHHRNITDIEATNRAAQSENFRNEIDIDRDRWSTGNPHLSDEISSLAESLKKSLGIDNSTQTQTPQLSHHLEAETHISPQQHQLSYHNQSETYSQPREHEEEMPPTIPTPPTQEKRIIKRERPPRIEREPEFIFPNIRDNPLFQRFQALDLRGVRIEEIHDDSVPQGPPIRVIQPAPLTLKIQNIPPNNDDEAGPSQAVVPYLRRSVRLQSKIKKEEEALAPLPPIIKRGRGRPKKINITPPN
jgi:hypothetical protein